MDRRANGIVEIRAACLLCGSKETQPLFEKQGKSFVRCRHCGLIYQDPPPSIEESESYYRTDYYESFGDQNLAIQKARKNLYQGFLSDLKRFRSQGRLLDIGCGHGGFLQAAQEEGWEAWGIEPSGEASLSAQKLLGERVLNATVEAAEFPENYFDVITLWNVIDCLPDPQGVIRKAFQWLAPGGRVVIRTPNAFFHLGIYSFYSFFRPVLRKLGWTKDASVFLRTNFDQRTLNGFLKQAGFSRIQIRNGKPTRGDAYQIFSSARFMGIAKSLIYALTQGISFGTAHRVLWGSNLMAQASKETCSSGFASRAVQCRIFLKSFALHALALAGYFLGLPIWLKGLARDRRICILRYHSISESPESDVKVRESLFKKQLDFLKKYYSVVSLKEAIDFLGEDRLPQEKTVVLTFDDGYEDNFKKAYPILREKGLPASIFLLAGEKDDYRNLPHLPDGVFGDARLLSWDEVCEMAASGITFGSHGQGHFRLSAVPLAKARNEIFGSKKKIESELGRPIYFFSYPYGTRLDFNQSVQGLVKEAGFMAAFSAEYGTNGPETDRFALKRIGIEASDSLFTFRAKLNGALGILALFDRPFFRKLIRGLDSFFLSGVTKRPQSEESLALVSVDFPPHTDGVSTISKELCARIAKRGKEIFAIGPKDRGDQDFDREQLYRVYRVPGYDWGYLRFFPILVTLPFVLWRRRIRKIFAMNIAYGGILSWLLSWVGPFEYLIFAYGYEFEKVKSTPIIRKLYLGIYSRAKQIITCSELVKARLVQFGVQERKIRVLYPAVDLDRFCTREVPENYLREKGLQGKRILLTVGRLIERKGHDRVLEALLPIAKQFSEVLYCIVGIGPHEARLRQAVERLGLENHVRFMGKTGETELIHLYNACEIFIMASREIEKGGHLEGFGIVYLEANACGKPVIGGRSGGVLEAIRDGETGLLVDAEDSKDIAEKIMFLLSHPEKSKRMGERGRERVCEVFNWERYTEEAYELLCGKPLK